MATNPTIREFFEAGVHYGHTTQKWNPKMAPYIFGERNGIHIIDLDQTVLLFNKAMNAIRECVLKGGRVLFVGTKTQAAPKIQEAAKRCGQYYINHRWLGGLLTNWKTVHQSIKRMKEKAAILENPGRMTKKEILKLRREYENLERSLGGISEMGGLPHILFVLDTNKEDIAVAEARKLGIPVVAIVDTNSNPADITYPIPGNDDATRSIHLYCDAVADVILQGLEEGLIQAGIDIGENAALPKEMNDKVSESKTKGHRHEKNNSSHERFDPSQKKNNKKHFKPRSERAPSSNA